MLLASCAEHPTFVALVKRSQRWVAIFEHEGTRYAILVPIAWTEFDKANMAGTLLAVSLMLPEVVPPPEEMTDLFDDPVFTGCTFVVEDIEPGAARPPRS
jgi:hypothetical protein